MTDVEERLALAPCPFCGGEAHFNKVEYSDRMVKEQEWDQSVFHGVNCINCGTSNIGLVGHKDRQRAAAKWNDRLSASPAPGAGGEQTVVALTPWRDELSEIIGHLGAAITQSVASDDQIIMDHVKAAHEIAKIVRRKA